MGDYLIGQEPSYFADEPGDLYWSCEFGWGDLETADTYTADERYGNARLVDAAGQDVGVLYGVNLPLGGRWVMKAPDGVTQANWELAGSNASLGVGHVWTATSCPAYRTCNPHDCTCRKEP